MKTVTIPFDLELAKKIQNGEVEGEIVDKRGINYEIVKWDASGSHSLICTNFNKQRNITTACTYTFEGKYVGKNKESDFDLQLVVPEYLTWKEGNYLTISDGNTKFIFIFKLYKSDDKYQIKYHAMFNTNSKHLFEDDELMLNERDYIYPSTPSEIAILTEELKKDGKKWNEEKKCIEDIQLPVLNFKDWCLARSDKSRPWTPVQFAFVFTDGDGREYLMSCGGISWREWIPMEGNEHLMGKTGE